MKPFEQYIRLLLELHTLMEAGKSESEEANAIRDKMDAPHRAMQDREVQLSNRVSEALAYAEPVPNPIPPTTTDGGDEACALTGTLGDRTTWCGRPYDGLKFAFMDANHAALNGQQKGRLTLCPACRTAIMQALNNGIPYPQSPTHEADDFHQRYERDLEQDSDKIAALNLQWSVIDEPPRDE